MDKTLIEKLQQIERTRLYDLLCDASIWKSLNIDYHPPHVERIWCQVGNYRLYLHFIQACNKGEALFHPHPWPSAIHVISGEYEMGMGFGAGVEPPEVFATILSQGSMYYEMPHIDGWHYVRPTTGPCASVMLVGEPWDREQVGKDYDELLPLHNDRIHIMLEWFKEMYKHTVNHEDLLQELRRGDWVALDESKMDKDDHEEYGHLLEQRGFVIKNSREDGLSIRFGKDRYDEFNHKVLQKLFKPDE